jgi:hypothetical protein
VGGHQGRVAQAQGVTGGELAGDEQQDQQAGRGEEVFI